MRTVAEALATRAEALLAIPSESRDETAILTAIRKDLPGSFEVVDDEDSVLLALPERRPGAPLVLLAGHVDTVPIAGSAPARRDGQTLHGRGASDMKAGLAVMEALADSIGSGELSSDLDVGLSSSDAKSFRSTRARSSRCSTGARRSRTRRSRSSWSRRRTGSRSDASAT